MRSVQRGITTLILVVGILGITIAATSAYFLFSQNLTQKAKSINSFEDCVALYPVMESYPEQCNTPDGNHFTKDLTEVEKQRLVPPEEPLSSGVSLKEGWKIYSNQSLGLEIQYPPNGHVVDDRSGEATLEIEYRPKGQNMDLSIRIYNNHTVNPQELECGAFTDQKNPNGTFVFISKKCQAKLEEIIIDGRTAYTFSDRGSSYVQLADPKLEIVFEGGIHYRPEYRQMIDSIKFLK